MITKFKIFESIDEKPEVGDYVYSEKYGEIGKVTRVLNDKVYHLPSNLDYELFLYYTDITFFSKSREELDSMIKSKKYNL